MTIDRRRALADHLRIGQRRERLGIQLRDRRRHRRGRIGPAQHKRRTQNGLIALTKGPHRAQHGLIPDQRRVAITIARGHRMILEVRLSK